MCQSDPELQKLVDGFKYETNEELERKRKVYLSFVVSQTEERIKQDSKNLEFNRKAYEALSQIVQKRERTRMRREMLSELLQWSGLLVPFIGGIFASPYIRTIWNNLLKTAI